MEHTKGEWEVYTGHDNQFADEPYILCQPSSDRPAHNVARVQRPIKGHGDVLANAQLIAAAPDLYEALKLAAELLQVGMGAEPLPVPLIVGRAITKAEGDYNV